MRFRDRADAGRRLGARLAALRGEDVVVLGLPRGGVEVAAEVARVLGAPLDVILVRKLGVPVQPELGMGAIGEAGARVINPDVIRYARVTGPQIAAVEARERAELERRGARYRGDGEAQPLAGRVAVIVDDGIATGSTARAACQVARARGAMRVLLAVPVAPAAARDIFAEDVDDMVALAEPGQFMAIGEWYDDFSQTSDETVVALLHTARSGPVGDGDGTPAAGNGEGGSGEDGGHNGGGRDEGGPPAWDEEVTLRAGTAWLPGHLVIPHPGAPIVVFAHGSGSSRRSPRNQFVAGVLHAAGLGTLLLDLLTPEEDADRAKVFDVGLLSSRLASATAWLRVQSGAATTRIGYFGASTGAAAALRAAAAPGTAIAAVVSRGGRPDLAGPKLGLVQAPTLLIVGGRDEEVLALNQSAARDLGGVARLEVVPGATHLFEEPRALEQVAELARDWFIRYLAPAHSGH